MGSRPPRQQSIPKPPRPVAAEPEQGVSMSTVTPMIGIGIFPIAFGSGAVAYVASGSPISVLVAILATLALGLILWAVLRNQVAWRRSLQPTNMFVMAVLIAGIGAMFLVGGVAAVAPGAILFGLVVMGGAWMLARR